MHGSVRIQTSQPAFYAPRDSGKIKGGMPAQWHAAWLRNTKYGDIFSSRHFFLFIKFHRKIGQPLFPSSKQTFSRFRKIEKVLNGHVTNPNPIPLLYRLYKKTEQI
jgi:hypothetical protein